MRSSDVGVFESRWDFQKKRDAQELFWRVITAYNEIGLLSPIVAINLDPLAKPTKLDATGIHFRCDVENATKKALGNNSSQISDWNELIQGEDVSNATEIIAKCARVYHARQLLPYLYFSTIKQGRPDRRQKIPAAGAS